MDGLKKRIREFQHKVYPAYQPLFQELSKGQSPEVLLITCSDSRIEPHLITGSSPGELFVIRNAGNVATATEEGISGESATIEYAVSALRVKHVVVCGHSGCGAMDALSKGADNCGLPIVADWLRLIDRGFERHGFESSSAGSLDELIKLNVRVQLATLRQHPAVAGALAEGRILLHGWVYDIGSGMIWACDDNGEFAPLVGGKNNDSPVTA